MKTDEQILIEALNEVIGCNIKDLSELNVTFDKENVDELVKICNEYFIKSNNEYIKGCPIFKNDK